MQIKQKEIKDFSDVIISGSFKKKKTTIHHSASTSKIIPKEYTFVISKGKIYQNFGYGGVNNGQYGLKDLWEKWGRSTREIPNQKERKELINNCNGNYNYDSVCFHGYYWSDNINPIAKKLSNEDLNAWKKLKSFLNKIQNKEVEILGHNQVDWTVCPGTIQDNIDNGDLNVPFLKTKNELLKDATKYLSKVGEIIIKIKTNEYNENN